MYTHQLTFTDEDRTNLHERHRELMERLESARGLTPEYFTELQKYMQAILQGQEGLKDFWDSVQASPQDHYHLHITHTDKTLLNLPWQIAIDTATYPSICITKGLLPAAVPYKPHPGPLRILVMISSPEDLEHDERLSYEEEEQVILKMLAPLWATGEVMVEFTENGSLQSLQDQLRKQHYHILYISGHGAYRDNTGYLQLENADTLKSEYVTAHQLGDALNQRPEHLPSLIILSSCQTARGNIKEGFRGIADELMIMNVPAVVAMAFSITDEYAIVFTGHLYQHLAHRMPLPEAYTKALLSMQQEEQEQLTQMGLYRQPSQWLIPQLYCNQKIEQLVDWQAAPGPLRTTATKIMAGEEYLLLSPGKDYYFIGRRRENALLFGKLTRQEPVLIKGQGGVGKTAMAEHLVRRLISQDPSRHCFAFDETAIGISSMITRLQQYLEREGRLTDIAFELARRDNIIAQLDLLIKQVSQICRPVWIFDNMESCQNDMGGPLLDKYREWMEYVRQRLLYLYPVIFTGRYPILELSDVYSISMNQVSLVDLYRKCLQLNIGTIQQENFHFSLFDTALLLYRTLGGSYRTLEFFDEIYKHDKPRVLDLLRQMQSISKREEPAKELMKEIQEKVAGHTRKIVFSALLAVLKRHEQETLHFFLYFELPVLQKALDMQRTGRSFDSDLARLRDLTLIEEQVKDSRTFYYLTPLVRDWLADVKLPRIEFYPEYLGNYFEEAFYQITHKYGDMALAFNAYLHSRNVEKINSTGAWLVSEYYRIGLYDLALYYAKKVEEAVGVYTHEEVFNNQGLLHMKYGKFDKALSYLTKFLIASRRMGDKNKETTALNSISQVYYHKGDTDTALEWLEKSRKMAKENGSLENEAIALTNTGNVYTSRKDYKKALKVYQQSLDIRKITGNRRGEITVLTCISEVYSFMGRHKDSIETLEKCLSIAVAINDKRAEGATLTDIGHEYKELGQFGEALEYLRNGLAASQSVGDREGAGTALVTLGLVYKAMGQFDNAVECLTKGALILHEFGYDIDVDISEEIKQASDVSARN